MFLDNSTPQRIIYEARHTGISRNIITFWQSTIFLPQQVVIPVYLSSRRYVANTDLLVSNRVRYFCTCSPGQKAERLSAQRYLDEPEFISTEMSQPSYTRCSIIALYAYTLGPPKRLTILHSTSHDKYYCQRTSSS